MAILAAWRRVWVPGRTRAADAAAEADEADEADEEAVEAGALMF